MIHGIATPRSLTRARDDTQGLRNMLLVAVLMILAAACAHGDENNGWSDALYGKSVCAPEPYSAVLCLKVVDSDGITPLANAEIKLADYLNTSSSGSAAQMSKGVEDLEKCVTDTAGEAACVLPQGMTGTIWFSIVSSGYNDRIIQATMQEYVTTNMGTQKMTGKLSQQWVVVPSGYDGVQVLLARLKGCTLNNKSGKPFDPATTPASEARTSQECETSGLTVLDDENTGSSRYITTFLKGTELPSNYGMLFINCDADYGYDADINGRVTVFLSRGGHIFFTDHSSAWLTKAFPGIVTFGPKDTVTGTLSSDAVDSGLAAFAGNPLDIVFDVPGWQDISEVASNVNTYIQADISGMSTLQGTRPITIGWRPTGASGCIFYASFHAEGAAAGSDQELAIKYLVQNYNTACRYFP